MPAAAGRLSAAPRARIICLLQTDIYGRLALMGLTPHKEGDETMMINNLTLQRIKEAASIVDVIGDFYDLKKKGTTYQCLCPFHNDHHLGSFVVSPRRNSYTCFACGAHGDAIEFLMRHERLTFFEAVAWLGKKYGIEVEGGERFQPKPSLPRKPAVQLPMLTLDLNMVKARLDTSGDRLCDWIRSLPWNDEQRARIERVLRSYGVGHARKGRGYTIFWQIDDMGNVRTGKFMLYRPDGHRDKDTPYNFTWAHSVLEKAGKIDLSKADMHTTLFGMHLLNFHPTAAVNIVESEKTALLASIMWGHPEKWIWMASGGLSMLNASKLKPVIDQGRQIYIYPDKDGVTAWKQQAMVIGYKGLHVDTRYLDGYWRDKDGQKADIGDIIVSSLSEPRTNGSQPSSMPTPAFKNKKELAAEALEDLCRRNPWVEVLKRKFNLEPVSIE